MEIPRADSNSKVFFHISLEDTNLMMCTVNTDDTLLNS